MPAPIDARTAETAMGHPIASAPSPWAATVSFDVVDETDRYAAAVSGATVEAVRSGRGSDPSTVLAVTTPSGQVTTSAVGFGMRSEAQVGGDRFVATFIHQNPNESRWCGTTLRPGSVIVYGPRSEHFAVNRPGLRFSFFSTSTETLSAAASSAGLPFEPPDRTHAIEYTVGGDTRQFGDSLSAFAEAAIRGTELDRRGGHLLRSMLLLLARGDGDHFTSCSRKLDSRRIVRSCLEHVDGTHQLPTIDELCRVAHVSERRLRAAFLEEFDQPPSAYFRTWALDCAHRQLRLSTPTDRTVTEIANRLGFSHLGRFAQHYRQCYGQPPSTTLLASVDDTVRFTNSSIAGWRASPTTPPAFFPAVTSPTY
jgi:AraC-like DNA-binding protein